MAALDGLLTCLRLNCPLVDLVFDLLDVLFHYSYYLFVLSGVLHVALVDPLAVLEMQVLPVFRVQEVVGGSKL